MIEAVLSVLGRTMPEGKGHWDWEIPARELGETFTEQ